MMQTITTTLVLGALLLSAAIFGFFYAWVCSTMWGLDMSDPRVAIAAMQAMNASVRNSVFFPAFFLTPVALGAAAALLYAQSQQSPAVLFAGAALVYFVFGLILTMAVNVPMNEALAVLEVPEDVESAREIWEAYSPRWQLWNQVRTVTSGLSFLLAAAGTFILKIA